MHRVSMWITGLFIITLAARPPALSAQGEAFKIGFLLEGSDLDPVRPVIEALRGHLLADVRVARALKQAEFGDIWLRPSDDPFDMIQRLEAEEFDLACATAVIYARQFDSGRRAGAVPSVRYEPIFQFRRPELDIFDPRGHGVWRSGVVFVGPASELWEIAHPTAEQIRAEIERAPIAVEDSYSATGYIYPRLKLLHDFPNLRPRGFLFCGSDASVIKHVVAGLAAVGACEAGWFPLSVEPTGASFPLMKDLFRTDRIPTDPILIHVDLMPQGRSGGLGAELKVALQSFFNGSSSRARGLRVEKAWRRSYEDMARALAEFDRLESAARGDSTALGSAEASEP
jgi:hypothetical protein